MYFCHQVNHRLTTGCAGRREAHVTININIFAENCYNVSDHGVSYAGQVSTTTSGAICQPWGENFPESKNYCRNPGRVGLSPWCFTDRAAGQWEYCDIQECGETTGVTQLATLMW